MYEEEKSNYVSFQYMNNIYLKRLKYWYVFCFYLFLLNIGNWIFELAVKASPLIMN